MSSRKIVLLALALPALGLTIYSLKYSGKLCGGENANLKRQQCPQLYECVLESNQPNALGVCRFLPNGLRLGIQPAKGKPAVESPTPKDPTVERNEQNKKAQRLTLAQNKFGFELLKTLALTDQTNTQNIAISPTSLGLAFDLLYNGAYGSTKDQLTTVLQIPSFSLIELNEAAKILLDRINTPTQDIDTTLANSIWIRTGETLNAAVLRDAAAYYLAHIANLDFTQPEASKTINDWISNRTAGKIPNALPGQIDAATIAYLINTAYFNGVWQYQFDPQQISMRDFYKQDGSRSPTQSMRMTRSNFLYLENEDLQAVKLPYGSEQKYSMVLLLPKSLGVNNLLQMLTATNWESRLSGFTEKEGTL
ncbi:hypothetical protein KJ912_04635, partial [Patescibacteria group bacterium]|nr:hypothetical protein [Patescibacteria group bacterium]